MRVYTHTCTYHNYGAVGKKYTRIYLFSVMSVQQGCSVTLNSLLPLKMDHRDSSVRHKALSTLKRILRGYSARQIGHIPCVYTCVRTGVCGARFVT